MSTIHNVSSSSSVKSAQEAHSTRSHKTRHQPPHTSDTLNKPADSCCLTQLCNKICQFFKWLCSCLSGRSNKLTPTEVQDQARAFLDTHHAAISKRYRRGETIPPVEAFKTLREEVQWAVLSQLIDIIPIEQLRSYIRTNPVIEDAVCKGLPLTSIRVLGESYRVVLVNFVNAKMQAATSSSPQQPVGEFIKKYNVGQDKDNLRKEFAAHEKEVQLAILDQLVNGREVTKGKVPMRHLDYYLLATPVLRKEVCEALELKIRETLTEDSRDDLINYLRDPKPPEQKPFENPSADRKPFEPASQSTTSSSSSSSSSAPSSTSPSTTSSSSSSHLSTTSAPVAKPVTRDEHLRNLIRLVDDNGDSTVIGTCIIDCGLIIPEFTNLVRTRTGVALGVVGHTHTNKQILKNICQDLLRSK